MRYQGEPDYQHGTPSRIGVLITNLGTPDAPTAPALRRYLKEFLWDPRVVEVPRPVWWLILNGIILTFRPKRSAAKYATIWTEAGSPLLAITQEQAQGLRERFIAAGDDDIPIVVGMRYGNPGIGRALNQLREQGVRQVLVLPLYPQYSASTVASTLDAVQAELRRWRWTPDLHFVSGYYQESGYIQALASSVRAHWAEHGRAERLLMSFHGVPKRYLLAGDPYHCQCHSTARQLAAALELTEEQWQITFQSRFGRAEWLRPYTDATLAALPGQGTRRVDVICPGFAADCLETLEEIMEENREIFLEAGGEQFRYIPALNARPEHLDFLVEFLQRHLQPWRAQPQPDAAQRAAARQRALDLGAKQ